MQKELPEVQLDLQDVISIRMSPVKSKKMLDLANFTLAIRGDRLEPDEFELYLYHTIEQSIWMLKELRGENDGIV